MGTKCGDVQFGSRWPRLGMGLQKTIMTMLILGCASVIGEFKHAARDEMSMQRWWQKACDYNLLQLT